MSTDDGHCQPTGALEVPVMQRYIGAFDGVVAVAWIEDTAAKDGKEGLARVSSRTGGTRKKKGSTKLKSQWIVEGQVRKPLR